MLTFIEMKSLLKVILGFEQIRRQCAVAGSAVRTQSAEANTILIYWYYRRSKHCTQ